jgi:hypothetical protein
MVVEPRKLLELFTFLHLVVCFLGLAAFSFTCFSLPLLFFTSPTAFPRPGCFSLPLMFFLGLVFFFGIAVFPRSSCFSLSLLFFLGLDVCTFSLCFSSVLLFSSPLLLFFFGLAVFFLLGFSLSLAIPFSCCFSQADWFPILRMFSLVKLLSPAPAVFPRPDCLLLLPGVFPQFGCFPSSCRFQFGWCPNLRLFFIN